MKLMELLKKYRDFILYAIFGVMTTCVNVSTYWLCAHPIGAPVMVSTVVAWIAAVLFAYLTNRRLVFHSENTERDAVAKEVLSFFLCRFVTGAIDGGCMYVFVKRLGYNDVVVKFLDDVLVIVLNFVASKLIIFKKK